MATVRKHLPKNATLKDGQYCLYVLEKIRNGLADIGAGRTLTQDDVAPRLAKRLAA